MKRLKIFLSMILLMVLFAVQNTYAVVDVTGTVTRSDRFEIDISQGSDTVASAYFGVEIEYEGVKYPTNAICCEHKDWTTPKNTEMIGKVYFPGDEGYNKRLATALYYGYWGRGSEQYTGNQSDKRRIISTSMIASYVSGTLTWWEMEDWDFSYWLMDRVKEQNIPDNIAYYWVRPKSSSDDAAYQSLGGIIELPQDGQLRIYKKDNYGSFIAGAKFRITGNNKVYEETTNSKGEIYLADLAPGDYVVEEITAPNNMTNREAGRRTTVTVEAGKEITYERTNDYPRGSVRLIKSDEENGTVSPGDATLAGGEFGLYAAENIKEGSQQIYTKDQLIAQVTSDADGNTPTISDLPIGRYYYKELKAPKGYNINTNPEYVTIQYKGQYTYVIPEEIARMSDKVVYGSIRINKRLSALDYDSEINLAGVQFKATLKSDRTQVYYSTRSGNDGLCNFDKIPYGTYEIEEHIVPNSAEKIANFDVVVDQEARLYTYTKVDPSKDMKISVTKRLLLANGEQTDATVEGAEFTVYRDAACTNKVCVIGPTDANGYAVSGTMRTGTYYLKETKFPTGIDPDALIPGENVTYRNKVYTASYSNTAQGTETVTIGITVQNEPKRNDIEIIKKIGATSNTSLAPLDKCEFTATLKSTIGTNNVFSRKCTAETDANGYCVIEDLPYGEYVVEETKVSPISLKCENFTVFVKEDSKIKVEPYSQTIVDEPKVMQIKIRKVDANRKPTDAPDYTQGDATLEGAIYQIYRYDPQTDGYTEKVYDITVDHKDSEGYWCAESDDLLVGKYMVKEKISYSETIDGVTYNYSYAEGYLADPETYYFEQRPDLQPGKRTYHYDTSKEEVIRGRVEVIKYDNQLGTTDEKAAEGAVLRLTLLSNPSKYYDVEINAEGYGEFVEEESREKYYPYTIPYGEYEITEIRASFANQHTSFFIQPEKVTITKQVQKEYRIESDEPVEMYLEIQKKDKDTGAAVKLSGARFKVWDCQEDAWVSQITYPSGEYIDEFETNEEGKLTLPHELKAGEYIIYETKAPEGYYLEEKWRLPEDEKDIGNADVAGKYVLIDKAAMGMEEDTVANDIKLYYSVDMPNEPLKGKLEIFKTGEMLTDANSESTDFGEKHTPVYTQKGLADVTYNIIAAEDIKSPDGTVTYVDKGTIVDTITTNTEGIATSKDLYLGEYKIVETDAPEGYLINKNIDNVILENADTLKRVEVTKISLVNDRQKLKLNFTKEYEEINYANGKEQERYAIFGVYTNEDIKNVYGNIIIKKDSLVDVIKIEGEEVEVTSNIDLPQGKYYVQELEASYPYLVNKEKKEIELLYSGNENEYITYRLDSVANTVDSASIMLVKISTSVEGGAILKGDKLDTTEIDKTIEQVLRDIQLMKKEEAKKYLANQNLKFVGGVEFSVYIDEDCTKPLYIKDEAKDEFVEAKLVTSSEGLIELDRIPIGKYYLKETYAPPQYEMLEDVIEIDLTLNDKDSIVYKILKNEGVRKQFITKTDIFTGEVIPGCMFEIGKKDGTLVAYCETDNGGNAYVTTDLFKDGETYTYKEISAPKGYVINEEVYEFVAKFDENGQWVTEKREVQNARKTIEELIVKKLDDKTGAALKECKFSIVLIDEEGNPVVNKDGEYIYLAKDAVTGENGEYVVKNPCYGSYQFIEIVAPEGYEMKVDMKEMVFTIDENSPETIVFEVTNAKQEPPKTGDIEVYTLSTIAIISMLGIAYVAKRNKVTAK